MSNSSKNKNHTFADLFGLGDIPGYLTPDDMLAISEITKKLPDTGMFVEVGTFLGKSAVEWARNFQEQNKNYRILCIDTFHSPIDILHELMTEAEFSIPPGKTQLELFKHYTKEYSNIIPLKGNVDRNFYFEKQIAGVFEDSEHTQAALTYTLPFWWERIQSGGILSGHDYSMQEVQTSVDLFAIFNELEVKVYPNSSVWYIEKP